MIVHELKSDPINFQPDNLNTKKFEIRFDDREFLVGDKLILRETKYSSEEMKAGKPLEYTGRTTHLYIKYILRGPCYGLMDGWVIMS